MERSPYHHTNVSQDTLGGLCMIIATIGRPSHESRGRFILLVILSNFTNSPCESISASAKTLCNFVFLNSLLNARCLGLVVLPSIRESDSCHVGNWLNLSCSLVIHRAQIYLLSRVTAVSCIQEQVMSNIFVSSCSFLFVELLFCCQIKILQNQ